MPSKQETAELVTHGLRRPRLALGEAARAGALAGLIGGAAMVAGERLEREAAKRLAGKRAGARGADDDWRRFVRAEAARFGFRLSPLRAAVIAGGLHIAYSTGLGALYGVSQRALPLPRAARNFLHDGLAVAAAAPARLAPRKPTRGRKRERARDHALDLLPLAPPMVFAVVTAGVFKALTRERRLD